MKRFPHDRSSRALTLTELLVVIDVVAMLFVLLVPLPSRKYEIARRVACHNNLKSTGLSFRLFATDNSDRFPMAVSTNEGGSMEYVERGNAFRHFWVMSNELSSPKVLICPADTRQFATNWFKLGDENVSYFVAVDAHEIKPQLLLSGDRNITNGVIPLGRVLVLRTNQPVGWTKEVHRHVGNVALADASVLITTGSQMQRQLRNGETNSQRVVLP